MRPLLYALAFCAVATTGCAGGFGPTVGYAFDRGIMFGWEAGGGCGPFLRGNVGGTYRATKGGDAIEAVHYLAYEPWFGIGATGGVGYSTASGWTGVLGVWEGAAYVLPNEDGDSVSFIDTYYVSLALGLRWLAGAMEIYLATKAGRLESSDTCDYAFGP